MTPGRSYEAWYREPTNGEAYRFFDSQDSRWPKRPLAAYHDASRRAKSFAEETGLEAWVVRVDRRRLGTMQ